ncbi:hypothetical protein [Gordonia aurantiaca]|uniref:hypothetical protein n=1 Tax=Gordonia sp. B21 TaxID=3151852 RepID=UPI0032676C02
MTRAHRRRLLVVVAAVVAAAVVGGLGLTVLVGSSDPGTRHSAHPVQDEHMPPGLDITFRWPSTPVLDPQSSEGTFVRAWVESFELATAGASPVWGYPGFVEASPSNIDQMITAYPTEVTPDRRQVGTAFYTGLRRVDDVDRTRIILCRHGYRSVQHAGRWAIGFDTPRPVEIDIRRVGDEPNAAPRGGERTPGTDVFGGWYTSRYDFAALYPTPTADQKACDATTPAALPRWLPAEGDQPWPTAPSVPGWSAYPGAV